MLYDAQSLSNALDQTPDESANTSGGLTSLMATGLKDFTVDQLAAQFDITVEELVEAVSKHAEEIHRAAQLALSATFVERLYAAYAGLANSTIENPQEHMGWELHEKSRFHQQYDEWEKRLRKEGCATIYLNGDDRMRLGRAFDTISSPGQDWLFTEHIQLRDHMEKVCPH